MRIIIEKDGPNLGGDISAISWLFHLLEEHKKPDARSQAILNLWIKYLDSISNQILRSHLDNSPMPEDFNLPFEQDFPKEYKILGGTK